MHRPSSPDLLLVNPGQPERCYQTLATKLTAVEPPIWAGLIATFVRRHGCSVEILDAQAEGLEPEAVARRVAAQRPLLAAVVVYGHNPSASTQLMSAAGAICNMIKAYCPEQRVLLVGGHVAALPRRTLEEEAADFVCGGEGPVTTLDLLQACKGSTHPNYAQVRGLWYRSDGSIRTTPPAPLVMDLDGAMPEVAWDLLPMSRYRAHNWHCFSRLHARQPYAAFYTTLGCPFRCSFCCIQAPFKTGELASGFHEDTNSYRYWRPDTIIGQIDMLVRDYGIRNIKIADEMFVLNRRHVSALCDRLIERGYDLNLWAYARVDTVQSDELIAKLQRAGFRWLALGIESASEHVRQEVNKGFTQGLIASAVNRVRQAGIHVVGNYLFGLPEDDRNSLEATLDLALALNTEWANFYCAMAYPGSALYTLALREQWPLPKTWSGYSQYASDSHPLPTRWLSSTEVLQFRDQAFRTYFTNPRYLDLVGATFGKDTLPHIHEMLSHKLERQTIPSWCKETTYWRNADGGSRRRVLL
ncbi:MAG: radical SAM protein [Nitrospirota bacterium]